MWTAIGIIVTGAVVLVCAALIYFSDFPEEDEDDEDEDGAGR